MVEAQDHIPILNYHGIEKKSGEYLWMGAEKPYVISFVNFKKQIDHLVHGNYKSLYLKELRPLKRDKGSKRVMLTFDDGHQSHYDYVAPYLKKKGLSAVFFISAAMVGAPGLMGWEQIRKLLEMGFEIGSHGLYHIALTNLTECELKLELERSKNILQRHLKCKIHSFSIPRGYYQARIQKIAKKAGYEFLFTSHFDVNELPCELMYLRRMVLMAKTTQEEFDRWVQGQLGFKRYRESLKQVVRKWLPPTFYDSMAQAKRGLVS